MFEIGRVCVKIAGRDAGKTAIVVDKASGERVLIDGNVRRRKCNIKLFQFQTSYSTCLIIFFLIHKEQRTPPYGLSGLFFVFGKFFNLD